MKFNGFIVGIFCMIAGAYFFPEGTDLLPLKTIIDIGIGLIFLFYGLKLSPSEFKAGILNYRIHLLIHLSTFLLFPLLCLACLPLFPEGIHSNFWIALFFLGTLPSTVSSSVVMVSLAKGNVPAAIFNASLSGLIGIFATPFWLSLILGKTGEFDFLNVVQKLVIQIIVPLVIGLLLQRLLGNWAKRYSKQLGLLDKGTILLIVYSSFSESFGSGLFTSASKFQLLKLVILVVIFFLFVYFLLGYVAQKLNLKTEDKITAQFCGTKKSLVHGSVMIKVIFGQSASAGLLLLPIMLYHSMQLILISWFAEKYRRREASPK